MAFVVGQNSEVVAVRRIVLNDALRSKFDDLRTKYSLDAVGPFGSAPPELFSNQVDANVERQDLLGVDFATIDPRGSMDLDQAMAIDKTSSGYLIRYAIADVGAYIEPDGDLYVRASKQGTTAYFPDKRCGLYPAAMSEGAASLLANQVRPALVWSLEVDDTAELQKVDLCRALVRSREQLCYEDVQQDLDRGHANDLVRNLMAVGGLLRQAEARRGGASLSAPTQVFESDSAGALVLTYSAPLEVELCNAQISLLTGRAAAKIFDAHSVGLLRTLPSPDPDRVTRLQKTAQSLKIAWPKGVSYAQMLRDVDASSAAGAAFLTRATGLFRGAGYLVVKEGQLPSQRLHAAIGADYAHVTAPLRRFADRISQEVAVGLVQGVEISSWHRQQLELMPGIMEDASRRDSQIEREVIDILEAALLTTHVGETLMGTCIDVSKRGSLVMLNDLAVMSWIDARLDLGAAVTLRILPGTDQSPRPKLAVK